MDAKTTKTGVEEEDFHTRGRMNSPLQGREAALRRLGMLGFGLGEVGSRQQRGTALNPTYD